MSAPYRILITGSRTWTDRDAVWQALADITSTIPPDREIVVVHGACPTGADAHAHNWALRYGIAVEQHPANWRQYGRAAGVRRNAEMVAAGADICLAFIRDASRGASHTARLAEAAGIRVGRWAA